MEITLETKFKVAMQYYGCDYLLCYNIEDTPVIERFIGSNTRFDMYEPDLENKRELLLLTPLSKISDEDTIEVAKICNGGKNIGRIHKYDYKNQDGCRMFIELQGEFPDSGDNTVVFFYDNGCIDKFYPQAGENGKHSDLRPDEYMLTYQYLQSKGYDLPHYLLNGKTPIEAGIALDKTTI